MAGPWTQTNEWRQAVSYGHAIGPDAGRAAIAVCKRMNSYPLGMSPGAQAQNCENLASGQITFGEIGADLRIEQFYPALEFLFDVFSWAGTSSGLTP